MWWIIILILLAIVALKNIWSRGSNGEAHVKKSARRQLPANTYYQAHNVTLPTLDGTTQIDHIFASKFGIFVVETKNMTGWIFGDKNQRYWTQHIFRKSFKFQNPLHQNYKHTKALEAILDIPPSTIHSVIVFVGDGVFKTPMPENVTQGNDCFTYIKSFRTAVLSDSQVQDALSKIIAMRLEPTRKTERQHIRSLKNRLNPSASRKCPKCGSDMILRTAKNGHNAGDKFWGCSAYPKCRIVQNIKSS